MASLKFIVGTLFCVNHCRYFHCEGLLGLIFAGYVPLTYQNLYPTIIDPILSHFRANVICNFAILT